jgi:hypothetical protein
MTTTPPMPIETTTRGSIRRDNTIRVPSAMTFARFGCMHIAMRRLVFVCLLLACGGGSSTPSISNLVYAPQSASAGVETIYTVTFDFDTAADVTTIEFVLINGPSKTPQDFPINNAQGVTNGQINAQLDITFQTPGSYEFGLDVLDANHKPSNQLTGVITVQ